MQRFAVQHAVLCIDVLRVVQCGEVLSFAAYSDVAFSVQISALHYYAAHSAVQCAVLCSVQCCAEFSALQRCIMQRCVMHNALFICAA